MSDTKLDRIEGSIDRGVAGALALKGNVGGTFTIAPNNMGELLEFAKLMAVSSFCVRPAFRGNPGACLAVALQAFRCGGDPFAWANKAYITRNKTGDEQIAYEAQLMHAIVNSSSVLQRRLRPVYEGQGQDRKCRIVGFIKGEEEALEYESPPIKQITVKNSPLWQGDPDQQLFYYSTRAWARRHVPEILLGIYAPEEFTETIDLEPEPEPQREDFIRNAGPRPEPEDDRPQFAVVDTDGVESLYGSAVRAGDALLLTLQEAAKAGSPALDGMWESNGALIDMLTAHGAGDLAADLATRYAEISDALKAKAAKPAETPAENPDRPEPSHPSQAEGEGRVRAQPADRGPVPDGGGETAPPPAGEATTRGQGPLPNADAHAASSPTQDAGAGSPAHASAEGDGWPGPPTKAQGAAPARETAGRTDMPANPTETHDAPPLAAAGGAEHASLLIPLPQRHGKPDYRTWAVALLIPKIRRIRDANTLAFLIGDNEATLQEAKSHMTPADFADVERAKEEQWRAIEHPAARPNGERDDA